MVEKKCAMTILMQRKTRAVEEWRIRTGSEREGGMYVTTPLQVAVRTLRERVEHRLVRKSECMRGISKKVRHDVACKPRSTESQKAGKQTVSRRRRTRGAEVAARDRNR